MEEKNEYRPSSEREIEKQFRGDNCRIALETFLRRFVGIALSLLAILVSFIFISIAMLVNYELRDFLRNFDPQDGQDLSLFM